MNWEEICVLTVTLTSVVTRAVLTCLLKSCDVLGDKFGDVRYVAFAIVNFSLIFAHNQQLSMLLLLSQNRDTKSSHFEEGRTT